MFSAQNQLLVFIIIIIKNIVNIVIITIGYYRAAD